MVRLIAMFWCCAGWLFNDYQKRFEMGEKWSQCMVTLVGLDDFL